MEPMKKEDIASREDLELLVSTFYARVRKHDSLGPIFNEKIHNWEEHLVRITDFWETTIFLGKKYHGNPMKKHLDLDEHVGNTIEQIHFGHWLQLWFETVDHYFAGEKAHLAKERARNMAHILFIRIFEQRLRK